MKLIGSICIGAALVVIGLLGLIGWFDRRIETKPPPQEPDNFED
jgi:hypothetical protein